MAPEGEIPTDPFALVGTLLERKYRIDRVVAEGGFGVVYAAYHLALHVPIAIKVLKPTGADPGAWAEALEQFLLEARTIAKLRHPGVVTVLDTGIASLPGFEASIPWIALEWLEGETLKDDLAARLRDGKGGRNARECIDLMRPVLEAVAYAHDAGIAHRDLKPSNIMLLPGKSRPVPRVLDFGIAKLMEKERADTTGNTATEATARTFSPAYAAPEQVAGTRTGPWTDVHALALIMTEILIGAPAYRASAETLHFAAVFDATRPTPGARGMDVGAWEPILARALAVTPSERYANAGELLAALDAEVPAPGPHMEETVRSVALPPSSRGGAKRSAWLRTGAVVAAIAALGIGASRWLSRGPTVPALPLASASSSPLAACTSSEACTRDGGGRASVCRGARGCVALDSLDCTVLADAPALAADDTVWIGTMFPKTGEDWTEFGRPNHQAAELARRDFTQTLAGLAGGDRARHFGLITCDDAANASRAAAHLVDDVNVPAVIGFRSSVEAIELSNQFFVPRRVVAMVANNTNPLVTTVPQPPDGPRMVWRTTANNTEVARALSAFSDGVLEPQIRAAGVAALSPKGAVRVALVRPKNTAGAAFSDAVFRNLRFNGKSALENGYDFRELTYDDATAKTDDAAIVRELVRFTPHIVLYAGGAPVIRDVFSPLEEQWPPAARIRPRYASAALITAEMLRFIGTNAERRRRFFGITPVSTTAANARFVMHYNETFDDKMTRTYAPNTIYDAFYLLAFASFTIPATESVTGASLARGFAKLMPPGPAVEVGLAGIFEAYNALQRGQSIDVVGATGSLNFDLATGEAPFDYAILCAAVDDVGRGFDGIESGLVYSAATQKLTGDMKCP